jgi:predicted amidohydrolase YtcJ
MNLVFAHVECSGREVDVRVRGDRVVEIGARLRALPDDEVIDARGGALLPGLHDHHIHLLATAAAMASVQCGPSSVTDRASLAAALRAAPGDGWIRGGGYAESVAGSLDRHLLDEFVADRPVRVQHRGGALWVLNSLALQQTGLADSDDQDVERDADGTVTGRLWRFDQRLRACLQDEWPDPDSLVRTLHGYGITGVTDATPDLDPVAVEWLTSLPLGLLLLGSPETMQFGGPQKLLLRDHDLPTVDQLIDAIARIHQGGRAVAVHCVTRESLILTLLALECTGSRPDDRIEHAAVVPHELTRRLAALDVAVVTQPSLIAQRGDDYLRDVTSDDLACLYPYASLQAAGIRVAPSSDAPYGELDPWQTLIAARDRTTKSGVVIGVDERVDTWTALRGYLSPPCDPGGAPREVTIGAAADLCLLDAPLRDVLAEPDAARVQLVTGKGELVGGSAR